MISQGLLRAKIYAVKNKNEAASSLKSFINTTRNLLGKDEKVCHIRVDNAREFTGGDFLEAMRREHISENIEADFSPPYTPELNGTAERFNKTIQQKIGVLMFDSDLPKTMWILAAETAVNMYNRSPHSSNKFETPLNKLNPNVNTHLDKIKRFGCLAYVELPRTETKFSEKAIRTVLVGYSRTGYVLWEPTSSKFLNSRHVRFNEKVVYKNVYRTKNLDGDDVLDVDENGIDIDVNIESNDDKTDNELSNAIEEELPKQGKPKKRVLNEVTQKDTEPRKLRVSNRKSRPNKDENFVYIPQ